MNQTTDQSAEMSLPKTYRPEDHEQRITTRWSDADAFRADPDAVLNGDRQGYSVVIPPPNVTAALHLGHALNNTLQDVLIRSHRMMGFETLWMPGADHAGIATQTVVEKRLIAEEGRKRTDFERDEFIGRVQEWKDEYEETIKGQLLEMGCSCDWERWRFTMDDVCAKAVREAFFQLFKDGLIYRGKRLVNWDPVTQTALADDEVDNIEIDGFFYYLRYPIVDADGEPLRVALPDGSTLEHVTVATTRPETYLGDTAVAVNPSDPRWPALRDAGAHAKLPFVNRVIPVIADDYVVLPAKDPDAEGVDPKAKYASGFLKVTPAHDPNDWEIGNRHDLAAINVMAPDASISDEHGWEDVGDATVFLGLSREDARAGVVQRFDELGLLADKRDYSHGVGHSYRSHVPIEPYLSDQWYVKVTDDRLTGGAQRALNGRQRSHEGGWYKGCERGDGNPAERFDSDGTMTFYPDRYAKSYETWHDNIRDWCISRQLWWGHRIPVWRTYDPAIGRVSEAELAEGVSRWMKLARAERVAIQYRGEFVPLERVEKENLDMGAFFVCIRDPEGEDRELVEMIESEGWVRDPDVLDTWFSSALWPMSTMGWPEDTPLLDAFNPTSVLTTAREIITLWVSRMVMFNRYFKGGDVPFDDVYIHAMIQDGEGRKMSKSLGNGVDPRDIIHLHGADALRFTLCQMTTQTQDVRMPVERDEQSGKNTSPKFDLGKRFCNKLWNASRFTMMMLDEAETKLTNGQAIDSDDLSPVDRWMLSRLRSTIDTVEEALRTYQFSVYAQAMYDLMWRDFCDWYLEAIKPTVRQRPAQQAVLRAALDAILRLLHPIAPFVTEAIHEHLRATPAGDLPGVGLPDSELICQAPWPEVAGDFRDEPIESGIDRLRDLVAAVREVRAQQQVQPRRRITLHVDQPMLDEVKAGDGFVETLAGLAAVVASDPEGAASSFTFDAREFRLSDLQDESAGGSDAERERLSRQIEELEGSIATLQKRLSNPGYTEKAPAHLVEQTRNQLAGLESELDAARKSLEALQ